MKILLATGIYPPDIGGPATYTHTMARVLEERGHEVEVVCYGDRRSEIGDQGSDNGSRITDNDFPVHRINRSLPLLFRYFVFAWTVFRRSRMMKANVVYLQGPGSEGFPGTIGAMLAGVPMVMKVVGDYAWEIYQGNGGVELLDEFIVKKHSGKVGLLERIERWTAKKAMKIITPSKYLASIVEKWGVSSDRISVIYNETVLQKALVDRERVRRTKGFENKKVVFYAGRAVPWKNVDFIIKLLPRMAKDVLFVVGGDGPSLTSWKSVAKRQAVDDRVLFLGKLDRHQMFELYHATDLFVLPSGYEGFPNVIPEAVSCGLKCFVSDKGGNVETGELFGTDRVTVLPYLNEGVWLNAINDFFAAEEQRLISHEPVSMDMVDLTEKILESSGSRITNNESLS